jgi:vacuolar-type H+-ATPase subunit F/Vma7
VICTHETALGFALSGIAPIEAATGSEAATALDALVTTAAHGGVILMEATLHDALPAVKRRQLRRDGLPIVISFPGPAQGVLPPEYDLLEVLRRAVGYRMRLR